MYHRRKGNQWTSALDRVRRKKKKALVRVQGNLDHKLDPTTIGTLGCLVAGTMPGLIACRVGALAWYMGKTDSGLTTCKKTIQRIRKMVVRVATLIVVCI